MSFFISCQDYLVGGVFFMTNEQKLQIAAYRKTGMGYKQIAKELDLSVNSVKSYCRRNGLSSEALEQSLLV